MVIGEICYIYYYYTLYTKIRLSFTSYLNYDESCTRLI